MPALGLAQDSGRLLRWLRPAGSEVAAGEPLMEIETDKITVEIEAPASGRLASIRAEGVDVPVGQIVAWILAPGEEAPVLQVAQGSRDANEGGIPRARAADVGGHRKEGAEAK